MRNLGNPGKDSGEPSSAVRTPSKPSGDDPRRLKAPSLPSEARRSIQRSSTTFAPRHPWVADTSPTSVPSELASRSSRSAKLAKIQISQSNHCSMAFSTTAIAAAPVILEVFTTFPELPLELRHKIWFYALPDARVIEVDFHENIKKWMCRHESQPNPSGMLRTNKESRKEFFRNYVPFINVTKNTFYSKNVHNLWPDSVSYFCPDIDTLYLSANTVELYYSRKSIEMLHKTECLKGMDTIICEQSQVNKNLIKDLVEFFPTVKTVIVAVGDWNATMLQRKHAQRGGEAVIRGTLIRLWLKDEKKMSTAQVWRAGTELVDPLVYKKLSVFPVRIDRGDDKLGMGTMAGRIEGHFEFWEQFRGSKTLYYPTIDD